MFVKRLDDGSFYLCSKRGIRIGRSPSKGFKSKFLVKGKYSKSIGGYLGTGPEIYMPKIFIGKRIRFKVEVVE